MRVEFYDGLVARPATDTSRLVVYDRFGNPLAAIVEHGGIPIISRTGEPGFEELLETFGLVPARTTVQAASDDFVRP